MIWESCHTFPVGEIQNRVAEKQAFFQWSSIKRTADYSILIALLQWYVDTFKGELSLATDLALLELAQMLMAQILTAKLPLTKQMEFLAPQGSMIKIKQVLMVMRV